MHSSSIACTGRPRATRARLAARGLPAVGLACAILLAAAPAGAQSFPLSQAVDVGPEATLVVDTARGRVEVTTGDGPIRVEGDVVVRMGWNVPADAPARARAVAAAPPIDVRGSSVLLGYPTEARTRNAVIIHWRVRVPRSTKVDVQTVSGEVRVAGVDAPVRVRSGSGATTVRDAHGGVTVVGRSGAIVLDRVAGDVEVRSGSGAVDIDMAAAGAVDVTTQSSAIEVDGASSALRASSGSGTIRVGGAPAADWYLETRSSRITIAPDRGGYGLDLRSRSGRVTSDLTGDVATEHELRRAADNGAVITARSGSGAIDLRTGS